MRLKIFTFLAATVLLAVPPVFSQERFADEAVRTPRSFLSNFGVSVNAGLSGVGATASVALHPNLNLRVGYDGTMLSHKLTASDYIDLELDLEEGIPEPDVTLKGKLKGQGFYMLLDYNPFQDGFGAFHVTAGFYAGSGRLVQFDGQFDKQWIAANNINPREDLAIDIEDIKLFANPDGSFEAYVKSFAVKPYLGVGWGNAIPKGRVGFRFDFGLLFQGKPSLDSPNMIGTLSQYEKDDWYKIFRKVVVWPQMSFQLTVRILDDKKR